ncbi:hypothetical protein SAMN04487944_11518 [Gracilibacillus ureilyticus]|uniref:Lipoprotein n=1 Tax=Gracilibacillus ureilyticus TaxID=531814 RepID=A0A1H9TWH2_9BACI|nr:hypothetical protein [Gracilibacillus ureilyticus]SES01348.1 hypothetical protein SAMN04487944_11518 [Gracilibacillus ureilyticus]
MKRLGLLLISFLLLAGCQISGGNNSGSTHSNTIIDWVDFLKWDDQEYSGIHSAVITDEQFIGEKVGEVQFNVNENVSNPSYQTRNGDAAYLDKGTDIYEVKGISGMLAVPSDYSINGYKLYYSQNSFDYQWHFEDIVMEEVEKIEIYQEQNNVIISSISNAEKMNEFLDLLVNSEKNPVYEPKTKNGDPDRYSMVFYTGDAFAYQQYLSYDGENYYWHPWDTAVVSGDIAEFLGK